MKMYSLKKLVNSITTVHDFAKYVSPFYELKKLLSTQSDDAFIVKYSKGAIKNNITIIDPNKKELNIHTSSNCNRYILIKSLVVLILEIKELIRIAGDTALIKIKAPAKIYNELLVYSTKHKVSQYLTNVSIDDVMTKFKTRLKDESIQISDFTFVDVINNKTLSVKPVIQVIDYIVE